MRKENHRSLGPLLALLLFGIFAACILMVLLTGADAYQHLTERDQDSYGRRTATQYLATRVRQADRAGSVSLEDFGGCRALAVREDIDGGIYCTWVYYFDGYLRELFASDAAELVPSDGGEVLEARGLTLDWAGEGLLRAEIVNGDGTTETVLLTLRSERGIPE